jgi:calcineurin-like phosphoesterase family protein
MIVLLGDIHGEFFHLARAVSRYPEATIIQLGDFGYWPQFRVQWHRQRKPVYFIEGNHDYLPHLIKLTKPKEIWPGLIYVPRATVLELEGTRFGFMGGAMSVDRRMRPQGGHNHGWFPEEVVTEEEVAQLVEQKPDVILAHSPPESTVKSYETPEQRRKFLGFFGLPDDFTDIHAHRMEPLKELGVPYFCGHMHWSCQHDNVRILNIGESVRYESRTIQAGQEARDASQGDVEHRQDSHQEDGEGGRVE